MEFLEEAKKKLWRVGWKITPEYRERLEGLLLEKLSKVGEITEDDRLWAKALVSDTFPEV